MYQKGVPSTSIFGRHPDSCPQSSAISVEHHQNTNGSSGVRLPSKPHQELPESHQASETFESNHRHFITYFDLAKGIGDHHQGIGISNHTEQQLFSYVTSLTDWTYGFDFGYHPVGTVPLSGTSKVPEAFPLLHHPEKGSTATGFSQGQI